VVDGKTGLLVKPRDVAALANALERLMTDGDLRERMGRDAFEYAQASFGIDRMLDAMEGVFTKVVEGRR